MIHNKILPVCTVGTARGIDLFFSSKSISVSKIQLLGLKGYSF